MEKTSGLDPKTGLLTQVPFEAILAYEVNRTQRYPDPITLLRFKVVSEEPLPAAARAAVDAAIAETLKAYLRQSDIAGHYEDDFIAILPHTDVAPGEQVARRILAHVREHLAAPLETTAEVQVCVGMTHFHVELDISKEMLIDHANRMLDCVSLTKPLP